MFSFRWNGGAARRCSALALLVARVLADHHDAAVATDHLALVTDRLDARVDLHVSPLLLVAATCTGRRCDHGSGRRGTAPPPHGPRGGSGCSAGASCR